MRSANEEIATLNTIKVNELNGCAFVADLHLIAFTDIEGESDDLRQCYFNEFETSIFTFHPYS